MDGIARRRPPRWLVIVSLLLAALWLVLDLSLAVPLAGVDLYHFKEPGCRLATGFGFRSTAFVGAHDLDLHLFSAYTPGYPLLFGLFAVVFGCGAEQNFLFDLAFLSAISVVFWFAVQRAVPGRMGEAAAMAIALAAPTGLMVPEMVERPEPLAILIGLGLIETARRTRQRTRLLYAIAALVFLVSPFLGLVAGALAYAINLTRIPRSARVIAGETLVGGLVFGFPISLVVAGYWLADPGSLGRFLVHTGIVTHATTTFWDAFWVAWTCSGIASLSMLLKWLVMVGVALAILIYRSPLAGALLCLLFLSSLSFPKEANYHLAVAILALALLIDWQAVWGGPAVLAPRRIALVTIAMAALGLPTLAYSILIRAVEGPTLAQQESRVAAIGDRLRSLGPTEWFVVAPGSYFLYRKYTAQLFDPTMIWPGFDLHRIVGAATCDAPDEGAAALPAPLADSGLVPLDAIPPISPPQFLGHRLFRRSWDYECTDYFRR